MTRQSKRRTPRDPDTLIESLADQSINIHDLAALHSISPAALLRWCDSEHANKRFEQHTSLYIRAAHLALSRASAKAAHALLELALDHAAPETARKACVDLIKLAPQDAHDPCAAPASQEQDDDEILRSLSEKLTHPREPLNT